DDMDATPFDPCNNPTDAMPIIIDNRISLRNRYKGIWKAETEWGVTFISTSDNPLRAAMEVFLMIKDAENEKV
ncbi:phage protein NinX family protein, partial [Vibrio cholerae]|uniref:phage protein NinX family protein n=1 Tax=Vibrio cholerae TaxID=666 RepID=UPI0005C65FAB